MVAPGPTMISCPACAGVVRAEVGPGHHLEFVCSVGHTFSLVELYVAKEDHVEYAQWSVLALLKHIQMILRIALEPGNPHHMSLPPDELKQRLDQVTFQLIQAEQLIEETRLPVSRMVRKIEDPGTEGV